MEVTISKIELQLDKQNIYQVQNPCLSCDQPHPVRYRCTGSAQGTCSPAHRSDAQVLLLQSATKICFLVITLIPHLIDDCNVTSY